MKRIFIIHNTRGVIENYFSAEITLLVMTIRYNSDDKHHIRERMIFLGTFFIVDGQTASIP